MRPKNYFRVTRCVNLDIDLLAKIDKGQLSNVINEALDKHLCGESDQERQERANEYKISLAKLKVKEQKLKLKEHILEIVKFQIATKEKEIANLERKRVFYGNKWIFEDEVTKND